jgi:hypothetical protein
MEVEEGDEAYPCWACGVLVVVPRVPATVGAGGGVAAAAATSASSATALMPARAYACGWCGAVNDTLLRPTYPGGARGGSAGSDEQNRYPGWNDPPTPPTAKQRRHREGNDPNNPDSQNRRPPTLQNRLMAGVVLCLRYAMVAVVVGIIAGIVSCGVAFVLPALYTPHALPPTWRSRPPAPSLTAGTATDSPSSLRLHTLLALWLGSNVAFYYAASAATPAGPVRLCARRPPRIPGAGHYARGAWQGWTWCGRCRFPKPSRASHCSTCNQCVVDLDHHCVFLARCVGRANLRAFVLFLTFAVVANSYVAGQTARLLWRDRGAVMAVLRGGGWGGGRATAAAVSSSVGAAVLPPPPPVPRGWAAAAGPGLLAVGGSAGTDNNSAASRRAAIVARLTLGAFSALAAAPAPLLAAFYLLAVSLATVLGTGVLLHGQLQYLESGQTYVAELKAQQQAGAGLFLEEGGGSGGGGGGRAAAGAARSQRGRRLWRALRDVMGAEGGPLRWLLVPRWDAPNLGVFPGGGDDKGE